MTLPRLYLVRHGDDGSADGQLPPLNDRPLSKLGERQAATLAGDLAEIRWDRAFSSPLVRARRTAEVILAARRDAPALSIDDRLRGSASDPGEAPDLAASFLAGLGDAGGTTLVVGHARMLRTLIAAALGLPPSFAQSIRVRNCRPAILEPDPRPLLLALNAGDPAAEASAEYPRLYLVRHGETEWNVGGRLNSSTDIPLNARGEAQASALAGALAGIRWDRAYASPLLRTRRTAEVILAARHAAPALTVDERLRETHLGPLEGSTEADPAVAAWRRHGIEVAGMEPVAQVAERSRSFLASLSSPAGPTLTVGHGRALRILVAAALGLPESSADLLRIRNCRPAVLEPGPTPILVALNAGDPAFEARSGPH